MHFPSKKKELWRYASKNTAPDDGTTNQLPQQHRLQHQHHPQLLSSMQTTPAAAVPPPHCYSNQLLQPYQQQQQPKQQQQQHRNNSCNCENCCEDMLVDDCEQFNDNYSSCQLVEKTLKQQTHRSSPIQTYSQAIATTTVKIFRNCCGSRCVSVLESSSGTSINNHNHYNSHNSSDQANGNHTSSSNSCGRTLSRGKRKYFDALMNKMNKRGQTTKLLTAIKGRIGELEAKGHGGVSNRAAIAADAMAAFPDCILVPRDQIFGEELHVITCRLFFWYDLKDASELKRLCVCDSIYACCNPLHWYRILETETAPPPYTNMERLRNTDSVSGENSQNVGNSTTTASADSSNTNSKYNVNSSSASSSSTKIMQTSLYVRTPESLTTDGKDQRSCDLSWCTVSYWELKLRVGKVFEAVDKTFNICGEVPSLTEKDMCLSKLFEPKLKQSDDVKNNRLANTRSTQLDDVKNTRQKIGLGVTLKQEADGVWLFNRSTVPIFVHSSTLSESCFHASKVLPGECLKAFDSQRAQSHMFPVHFSNEQGPVDFFSMCISFAKGWGGCYTRRDITCCPCWVEVHFNHQR